MQETNFLRTLSDDGLADVARGLYGKDDRAFFYTLASLAEQGTVRDFEVIAQMLSVVPIGAVDIEPRYTVPVKNAHARYFVKLCIDHGYGEELYMPVLLNAQYARQGSALAEWDKGVRAFVEQLARTDLERAAELVERYDKKLGRYSELIKADRDRALIRLVDVALFATGVDKSAVRELLMDFDEVAGYVRSIFDSLDAHARVAAVRLLLVYKTDPRVREFLEYVAQNDSSSSVRAAAAGSKLRALSGRTAAKKIERLMIERTPLTYAAWQQLLCDDDHRAVAESIFFYVNKGDTIALLVYDNGSFLDSANQKFEPAPDRQIYVLHPLNVSPELSDIFLAQIDQPFLQIERPVYAKINGETRKSTRLNGTVAPRDHVLSKLREIGFVMTTQRLSSEVATAIYSVGDYSVAVELFGLSGSGDVSCGNLYFYRSGDIVKLRRSVYVSAAQPALVRDVPEIAFSEMMFAVERLFNEV